MLKASDVMTKDVATIRSSATVAEAVQLMRARDWRSLIVERRHEQDAYGIISESDIVYKVIAYGKDPHQVRVYEVMTKPCITINPDLGLEYVARLFANYHLHRAPVIQGELVGIISITDILAQSQFLEQPYSVLLEQQLQDEIKKARSVCSQIGANSEECAAAWDAVEQMQSEIAHQTAEKVSRTPFDDHSYEDEALEARVYER
jgi:CBS domain-containing protein